MFIERYEDMQSDEKFLEIEGTKIVSISPTPPIAGVGTGCVAVVGEFLKGDSEPAEVFGDQDIVDRFGGFCDWNNPGGPIGSSSGIAEPGLNPTSYDGNGYLAIFGRKFPRLVLANVDQAVKSTGTTPLEVEIVLTKDVATVAGAVVIPAGVRVAVTGATPADVFATIEDIPVTEAEVTAGYGTTPLVPGTVKKTVHVRRVKGTTASTVALAQVLTPENTAAVPGYTLTCTQSVAALVDVNLVTAYTDAISALLSRDAPAGDVDILYIARHLPTTQGETLMKALRTLAADRSAIGKGLRVIVSPPIGTPKDTAEGSTASTVGVGNVGGSGRVDYAYPAVLMYVPVLATATCSKAQFPDGRIYWPFDSAVATLEAYVAPEVNPGVQTQVLGWVLGIEKVPSTSGGTATALALADYKAFRRLGIMAPNREGADYVIQSGVTSKGAAYPVKQERMADYIEDSLAIAMQPYQKQPATAARKNAIVAAITEFLDGLLSPSQPGLARIVDYDVSDTTSNTAARLGKGIYIVDVQVQTTPGLDAIVLKTLIGETIEIQRAA